MRPGGHRQHDKIGFSGECFGEDIFAERRRDHKEKIIGLGQGIEHMSEFMKIELAVSPNPQKMKSRARIAVNDFGE